MPIMEIYAALKINELELVINVNDSYKQLSNKKQEEYIQYDIIQCYVSLGTHTYVVKHMHVNTKHPFPVNGFLWRRG